MPLPKIDLPLFELELPSNKKKVKYRQMLVKDEKILLLAKESDDDRDVLRAIKQVVSNCLVDTDIDTLTSFDLELLFIKIRAVSIGDIIELSFVDKEDEQTYKFEVDLDKVEIKYTPDNISNIVKVSDNIAIELRYPPSSLYEGDDAKNESYEWLAAKCINSIIEGEEVFQSKEHTIDELKDFINNLDVKSYAAVKNFISNSPHVEYVIEYKNKMGTERKITLDSLSDFFTF